MLGSSFSHRNLMCHLFLPCSFVNFFLLKFLFFQSTFKEMNICLSVRWENGKWVWMCVFCEGSERSNRTFLSSTVQGGEWSIKGIVLDLGLLFRLGMLRKMDGKCLLAALSPKHEMKSKDSQRRFQLHYQMTWTGIGEGEVMGQWNASCGFILFQMKTLFPLTPFQ